ncbi:glycoside hydrolase family 16 protein [Mycena filopes]|nr:glycoside hydrolase family 16 protein [Mycena filopes]
MSDPFADPSRASSTPTLASAPSKTRAPSTALPTDLPPYTAVPKPWTATPAPRATYSYYLTYLLLFLGAALGATQSYLTFRNVRLDKRPLCLVFEEEFNEGSDAQVFGSGGQQGHFLREVSLSGSGNGQFEMTTSSPNNSFLQHGNLYIVPTLTPGAPFPDGTTYEAPDCTFNLTAEKGGFDSAAYFTACARTTNSTAGTIINPVQSARLTTVLGARGDESTLSRGSLRYGRVEVRAKMPTGDWLWPAIWLLPVNNTYGPWPRSGEIDMVESRGNGLRYTNRGANYVQGALNWGPTPELNGVGKSYSWWADKRTAFSEGFHTYAMEWTEEWIRISVDTRLHTLLDLKFDQPFWTRGDFPQTVVDKDTGRVEPLVDPWVNASTTGVNGGRTAPFDQDFYLIMNVAVGGTNGWFPDGQGDKPWLNQAGNPMQDFINNKAQWLPTWPEDVEERAMVVDYVRMWKHCGDP